MYYGIDDSGRLIGSTSNEILPLDVRDNYPDSYDDVEPLSDTPAGNYSEGFLYQNVSSGDPFIYIPTDMSAYIADSYAINSPGSMYPNSAAVQVFQYVLEGLDYEYYYAIYSGSDSNTAYLIYSSTGSSSGKTLNFTGDVTLCSYYRTRQPNSSWIYQYSVQENVGDQTVNIGNSLVYTNFIDGYPDIAPIPGFMSTSIISGFIVIAIVILAFCIFRKRD